MMLNITLDEITSELNQAIENVGGIDNAIEACDRMYSATFRSEGVKLCDYLNKYCKTMESYYTEYNNICEDLRGEMINQFYNKWLIEFSQDDNEGSFNYWEDSNEGLIKGLYSLPIKEDTEICDLCNYKGEGEGLSLLSTSHHLPIFKNKNESFFQVNK